MNNAEKYRNAMQQNRDQYGTVSFTLSREFIRKIDTSAQEMGVKKAELLRRAITAYLSH